MYMSNVMVTMAVLCTVPLSVSSVGTIVLLAIALLSRFFHYIPQTTLAAIIIAAVLPMVDVCIVYKIFKIRSVCVCMCACEVIECLLYFLSELDDIPLVMAFLLTLILGIEVQRCMYIYV